MIHYHPKKEKKHIKVNNIVVFGSKEKQKLMNLLSLNPFEIQNSKQLVKNRECEAGLAYH
jgi:hypothetical protein